MSARPAPPKPWERQQNTTAATSSVTPVGPSTAADGAPKPWELPQSTSTSYDITPASTRTAARPWERDTGLYSSSSAYGGGAYGSSPMYSRPSMYGGSYGSSSYGTGYGGALGSSYGGGYGGYGGSSYGYGGSGYGGIGGMRSGMYGGMGGGYGGSMMGPYGGAGSMYGGGMLGPDGRPLDPNDPAAARPPSAWESMLRGLHGVVTFFSRISFLVDENTHAVHFFISALLQLLDRAGSLYGELARFVLRLLGYRGKPQAEAQAQQAALGPSGAPEKLLASHQQRNRPARGVLPGAPPSLPGAPVAPTGGAPAWDNVWGSS